MALRERGLVLEVGQPLREELLQGALLIGGKGCEQATLVCHVLLESAIDELSAALGECDDPPTAVGVRNAAGDQSRCLEPVDALGHGPRRHHGVLGEPSGGKLKWSARSAQGCEHIEVPLPQTVLPIDDEQLISEVSRQPVEASDNGRGRNVEVGSLASPGLLYAINGVHPSTISSTEAIVSSVEDKWKWMAITAIAPVTWGATYFVTSEFLPADYPLWGGVIRALPAGILLLAITRRRPRGSWWWKSAVLGALNVGAFFVLVYLAAQLLPSSIASTLMATSAAVMMLLAWPILGDRPRLLSLAGALIGFTGVAVMLANGDAAANGWGIVASLAAMTMSSIGYVLAKRWSTTIPILATTSWQLIAGGLIVAPVAMIVEGPPPTLDPPAIAAFAFVSFVATALAFVAWFTGLRHLPAGSVGLIGLLNPVTGVLLGVLLAGEPFGILQLVGVALVLTGVTLGHQASKHTAR